MTTKAKFGLFLFSLAVITSVYTFAQSDLFRLRTALSTSLITVDGKVDERFEARYLLDNSSCIVMILDKKNDSVAGITQVNKASCNKLSSQ